MTDVVSFRLGGAFFRQMANVDEVLKLPIQDKGIPKKLNEQTEWRIVKQWVEATTALAAIERANPTRPSRPL